MLRAGVRLVDLDADVKEILEHLRRGDGLPLPSMHRVTMATRAGKSSGTDIMKLTPLSAAFLRLCDGRTLDRVSEELKLDDDLVSMGREQIGVVIFHQLCRQRLLTWRESSTATL
jgi:hypothetical protein